LSFSPNRLLLLFQKKLVLSSVIVPPLPANKTEPTVRPDKVMPENSGVASVCMFCGVDNVAVPSPSSVTVI